MMDLEVIEDFAKQMREMNSLLYGAKRSSYKHKKERLFLDGVGIYIYINTLTLFLALLTSYSGVPYYKSYPI